MNQDTFNKYYDEIPEEIRDLLSGLANEKNLAILVFLLKNGKMKFNEIKKHFGLSSSSLTNLLTKLQDGNLVQNFYEKSGDKGFSYYDVTETPELVFDSLFQIMYSSESITEKTDNEKIIPTRELISETIDIVQRNEDFEKKYLPKEIQKSLTPSNRKIRINEIPYQGIRGSATI